MCTRTSRWTRACFVVIVLILGIFCDSAYSCNVERCWEDFQTSQNLNIDAPDVQCTALRTYMKCLESLQGCKGNIKFHSMKKVIRNQMNHNDCTTSGPVYTQDPGKKYVPVAVPDAVCTYKGKKIYKHCGLFGDPHLRTFDNRFQTCRVEGAWPLVNNDHLTVQVTNDPVSNSVGATATSKLTVLIKKNADCASHQYITYQAESGVLPATFDDGQTMYGKSHSVELIEVDPGKHVEIILKYIDTKIIVRQVGHYLTFAISMPEELLNSTSASGLELCVRGCPESEIINYQKFLALKEKDTKKVKVVMSREDAVEICRNASLVDFYMDSCVFDLMTTGNENFTVSALSALQDLLKLDPNYKRTQKNRTSLEVYDDLYGGSSSHRTSCLEMLKLMILSAIMCYLTNQMART